MARLNQRRTAQPRTPITTTGEVTRTAEGGVGFLRTPKAELFLSAVSDFSENTFYESAEDRARRQAGLIGPIAVQDPEWTQEFIGWLRRRANIRTAAVTLAASAVHARLAANLTGHNRQIVSAALLRADEPGEFLAHWLATYGRNVPMPVKRGLADAALRTYNESAWLKWRGKGAKGSVSMADVLRLTHPDPKAPWQSALFAAILGKSEDAGASLPVVEARSAFLALPQETQVTMLTSPEAPAVIRDAALTHEVIAGALGKIPPEVWGVLVPTMGYQALLMNLRRMVESGVSPEVVAQVSERLTDADEVRRSRMLPMRMLSAYRNAPVQFHWPLEQAAQHSLANVPELPGRTLVLVDCSGSMYDRMSARSELTRMDAAALFGSALALRGDDVTLVQYGTSSRVVPFRKDSESVLPLAARMRSDMGGTHTAGAVSTHYNGHDRVVVLTDEQAHYAGSRVFSAVPEKVHAFTWNVAGYVAAHAEATTHRHAFGGLNDAAFDLVRRVETGFVTWPWEDEARREQAEADTSGKS